MPRLEDAAMWPSFVLFAWYLAAMKSDMVLPPDQALYSMTSPGFLALTHTTSFFTLYQALRAIEADMEKADRNWAEALTMVFGMTIFGYADLSRALYFSASLEAHEAYLRFAAQTTPGFLQVQVRTFLGGMYTANVLCAMASAKHHKAVTDEQIKAVSFVLNFLVYSAVSVYACLYIVADGNFVPAFLDAILWFR